MIQFKHNSTYIIFCILFLAYTLLLLNACGSHSENNNNGSGSSETLQLTINGDGLFILKDSEDNIFYTRYGLFYLDSDGYIVNADGYRLQGYPFTVSGVSVIVEDINISDKVSVALEINRINVDSDGIVTYESATTVDVSVIVIARFLNTDHLRQLDNFVCEETAVIPGMPVSTEPGDSGAGEIEFGYLEGSYECDKGKITI